MADRTQHPTPSLFFLHFLGGSGEEWSKVVALLSSEFRCVAIDLAGFGNAAKTRGYTVAEMADRVGGIVRSDAPGDWFVIGHSMGAKVAAAVARRAENGEYGLDGLKGLILIAGSPPCPEPMDERQRETMKNWFRGDPQSSRQQAQHYINRNITRKLDAATDEQAVSDVLRANRDAWVAWLDYGSREDWSREIAMLQSPALLIAGSDDENLGAESQRKLMAPHFNQVKLLTLPDAKHLLPLECPDEVATLIREHARWLIENISPADGVSAAYRALIDSGRVGARTRSVLLERAKPDDVAYDAIALTAPVLEILRAALQRILPQQPTACIDIAARIDVQLASGQGDGWRRAELPADVTAYNTGLLGLDAQARMQTGKGFIELDGAEQDRVLSMIGSTAAWMADLRSDAVQIYVSHPATLEKMGYSGIANGGDGLPKSGFVRVGADEVEAWEPLQRQEETR